MLDPKRIRDDSDVTEGLKHRKGSLDLLAEFKRVDKEWRDALSELDTLKHKRNQSVPKGKPSEEDMLLLKELSQEIKDKQQGVSQ